MWTGGWMDRWMDMCVNTWLNRQMEGQMSLEGLCCAFYHASMPAYSKCSANTGWFFSLKYTVPVLNFAYIECCGSTTAPHTTSALLSITIWLSDASFLSSADLSIHWIRQEMTLHISNWDIFLWVFSCISLFPPVHCYLLSSSTIHLPAHLLCDRDKQAAFGIIWTSHTQQPPSELWLDRIITWDIFKCTPTSTAFRLAMCVCI